MQGWNNKIIFYSSYKIIFCVNDIYTGTDILAISRVALKSVVFIFQPIPPSMQ